MNPSPDTTTSTTLARRLGLWLLTFYGLGNILGAGIYVLIGEVAGSAGLYAPLSFLLAAVVAGFSAFSYAELSARYPFAAGEAVYIENAFHKPLLSALSGLLILFAGMLSAATIARGFAGYLRVFTALPEELLIVSIIILLGVIAIWGIAESVRIAATITLLEICGLLLIIAVGAPYLGDLGDRWHELPPLLSPGILPGIAIGGFLAFFAFIGFEDMVNVAEEVNKPRRDMPRAIMLALIISLVLYVSVALVSVIVIPLDELAASEAPLAAVYTAATGKAPVVITLISLFAVLNGALIQIIMASRICYGMSRQGWLPALFSRVNNRTRTPAISTIIISSGIVILALWFPLVKLAAGTSYLVLVVFLLINLALLRVRGKPPPEGVKGYPVWVPLMGAGTSLALLTTTLLLN